MRRLLLLIIALATLLPTLAQAYDVLILQSRREAAYDEVLKGFRFEQKSSLRLLVLADYAEVDLARIVREDRPRVILAIGDAALSAARKIHNTPVVAVMALGIHSKTSQTNLTGIGMYVAPERYMGMFKSIKAGRIGVVYNPAKSGWYLKLARLAAEDAGVELVTRVVTAPREAIGQLESLAGKVDALWMLPDSTAVTRESTEAYFRFGQNQNVPVISFAASYLGLGAAAVLEIDRVAIGSQADAMVAAILGGDRVGSMPLDFPQKTAVRKNGGVLGRLKMDLN